MLVGCLVLDGEEAVEEGAVAFEGLAEVFGVDVFAAVPLLLQLLALGGELLGDALDDVGDEAVCMFYSCTGLIDEGGLHLIPIRAESLQLILREERVILLRLICNLLIGDGDALSVALVEKAVGGDNA